MNINTSFLSPHGATSTRPAEESRQEEDDSSRTEETSSNQAASSQNLQESVATQESATASTQVVTEPGAPIEIDDSRGNFVDTFA